MRALLSHSKQLFHAKVNLSVSAYRESIQVAVETVTTCLRRLLSGGGLRLQQFTGFFIVNILQRDGGARRRFQVESESSCELNCYLYTSRQFQVSAERLAVSEELAVQTLAQTPK